MLKKGEIISILGENGSGKSTLLNIIAGLLQSDSGAVVLNKEKIKGPAEKLIPGHAQIKMVFQAFNLAHNLSVFENIYALLPPIKEEQKLSKTRKILRQFKLKGLEEKKVEKLSGGEKQRLSMARAFASLPEVLLFDEAFSNVDSILQEALKKLVFGAIQREKISALFVTHDFRDALRYSDRILIMKAGKVVAMGTPEKMYQSPKNSYCAKLTGPVNLIPGNFLNRSTTKILFVRPEHILLREKGKKHHQAVVVNVFFVGSLYEIYVFWESAGLSLKAYSSIKYRIGEELSLDFCLS